MSGQASPAYSALDRALHRLAFGSRALQGVLADLEQALYSKQWRGIDVSRPIFITSLPRAGTSVLLQALNRASFLATHTYRDMPFILTPVVWQSASRAFRRTSEAGERAHGDGLAINEDSPEAFEEVLWMKHFPEHYDSRGIGPWRGEAADGGFAAAFAEHMRKVAFLRRVDEACAPRYISKNNANIARIGYLRRLFPDASFIVPLRHPLEQAISLLRQHTNFTRRHAEDAFSRRYMEDIGHFEFGSLHRPIRFTGFRELAGDRTPDSADYWLAYWIAAFGHVAGCRDIHPVSFEGICSHPEMELGKLLEATGLEADREPVASVSRLFQAPPGQRRDGCAFDPDLVARAMEIYASLLERGEA